MTSLWLVRDGKKDKGRGGVMCTVVCMDVCMRERKQGTEIALSLSVSN